MLQTFGCGWTTGRDACATTGRPKGFSRAWRPRVFRLFTALPGCIRIFLLIFSGATSPPSAPRSATIQRSRRDYCGTASLSISMSSARTASQFPAFWLASVWTMSRRRSSRLSVSVLVPHGIRGRFRDVSGYFSIYQLIPAYFFLWRVSSVSVVVLPFKFENENHLIKSQLLGVVLCQPTL